MCILSSHPSDVHARYYWLLLAEGHLHRRQFGQMLRRIWALPTPSGQHSHCGYKIWVEGGRLALCLRNQLRGNYRGASDGQKNEPSAPAVILWSQISCVEGQS